MSSCESEPHPRDPTVEHPLIEGTEPLNASPDALEAALHGPVMWFSDSGRDPGEGLL